MVELAEQGVAILMISSELPEILGMSDRIAVMHGGTIVGVLDRAEATQERVLELALGEHTSEFTALGAAERPRDRALATLGRHKRELPPAAALLAVLLGVLVAAPSFFGAGEPARPRAEQRAGAARRGRDDAGHPRRRDRHLGRLAVRVCGVVAGLLGEGRACRSARRAGRRARVGAAMGAVNGCLVGRLGLPSIVVTLAMLVAWREALRWAPRGRVRAGPAARLPVVRPRPAGGAGAIVVVAVAVLAHRRLGPAQPGGGPGGLRRRLRPRGGAARRHRPQRVVFGVFVADGALVGLAALLNAVRFPRCRPNAGIGLELQVIAAVVVGGTAISGGAGRLLGTLIGVLLLGTIGTALMFLGISPSGRRRSRGSIILAALVADAALARLERHGSLIAARTAVAR